MELDTYSALVGAALAWFGAAVLLRRPKPPPPRPNTVEWALIEARAYLTHARNSLGGLQLADKTRIRKAIAHSRDYLEAAEHVLDYRQPPGTATPPTPTNPPGGEPS